MVEPTGPFHEWFVDLFNDHFPRLFRFLDRESADPELAADLAQEAFVRLYRRGERPDAPTAWLITVALNLLRNERSASSRRKRLLTASRSEGAHSDPAPSPEESALATHNRERVRSVLQRLPERERRMLLLQAEGYGYSEIAEALETNESSIGTMLARARRSFREMYGGDRDAS